MSNASLSIGRRLVSEVLEPLKQSFVDKDEIIDLFGICLHQRSNRPTSLFDRTSERIWPLTAPEREMLLQFPVALASIGCEKDFDGIVRHDPINMTRVTHCRRPAAGPMPLGGLMMPNRRGVCHWPSQCTYYMVFLHSPYNE